MAVTTHHRGVAESREMPEARAELVLEHLRQLPTLPQVALRLLEVTTSDTTSAADVVRLIESDPALTVKILRLVQKAHIGRVRGVVSVDRAVVLLGFEQVRNAVLSVQVYDALQDPANPVSSKVRTELWRHALGTAVASKLLAEAHPARPVHPDEAFIGGLLHDVGKLALEACLPKAYERVVRLTEARHACICDTEREVFGMDHTVAGKRLMSHWGLPAPLVECAWLHHHLPSALPPSVAAPDLIAVVHLADELVRQHRIGYSGYFPAGALESEAAAYGLTAENLRAAVQALPAKMEELSALFQIDDLNRDTVFLQALTQANAELGRTNSRLSLAQERLERRSRCFEAMRKFSQYLRGEDGTGRVCETIAEVAATLFVTNPAVVAVRSPATSTLQFGMWDEMQSRSHSSLPASVVETFAQELDEPASEAIAWRAATPAETDAYHRFRRRRSNSRVAALPIQQGDRRVGVILAEDPDALAQAWTRAGVELEGLSATFALALEGASAREARERVAEELAEANRRVQAAQSELLRNRSLAMIAAMAAGAAHELNNPLAVISGRAQMLAQTCTDAENLKALTIVSEQAKRASGIVSELMAFAKPDRRMPMPVLLTDLLETVYRHWMERSSLRAGQLEVHVADPATRLLADPAGVVEVLHALMSNAVEATRPDSARIYINSPSSASDETVRIRIEDNGAGMAPEVLEHAFDPFFSHRTAGRGRGMGLSRAQRIVEMNGGRLRLESAPGEGTIAYLDWPAAAAP